MSDLIKLPDPGGYTDPIGPPCGECGAYIFDVTREMVEVEVDGGEVRRIAVVSCQCPRFHEHKRARMPRGLEILGTLDVRTGELEMLPRPILASEMEPEDAAVEYGPDVMDACPTWEGDDPPMLAGVLVDREWDGDESKAITARRARDIAADAPKVADRPPIVGCSTRPPLAGRAIWAKDHRGIPVECPKGIPHDALGWGFEGDDAWRPLAEAKASGLIVLKAPGRKKEKQSPPMEAFAR